MSVHRGISCDKCSTESIKGFRYACLVCKDYDLCEECHQKKGVSLDHLAFHPMLSILTPKDMANALKNPTANIKIFSCSYCGVANLSVDALTAHCLEHHSFKGCKVRCPICVTFRVPNKKYWIAEDTLLLHLLTSHQNEDGYVLDPTGNNCPVCVENLSAGETKNLICSHVFHKSCINKWLLNKDTCPLCRKDVSCNRTLRDMQELIASIN